MLVRCLWRKTPCLVEGNVILIHVIIKSKRIQKKESLISNLGFLGVHAEEYKDCIGMVLETYSLSLSFMDIKFSFKVTVRNLIQINLSRKTTFQVKKSWKGFSKIADYSPLRSRNVVTGYQTCKLLKVFFLWSVKTMMGLPNRIFLYSLQVSIADNNW
jgi:hypothetical protein